MLSLSLCIEKRKRLFVSKNKWMAFFLNSHGLQFACYFFPSSLPHFSSVRSHFRHMAIKWIYGHTFLFDCVLISGCFFFQINTTHAHTQTKTPPKNIIAFYSADLIENYDSQRSLMTFIDDSFGCHSNGSHVCLRSSAHLFQWNAESLLEYHTFNSYFRFNGQFIWFS